MSEGLFVALVSHVDYPKLGLARVVGLTMRYLHSHHVHGVLGSIQCASLYIYLIQTALEEITAYKQPRNYLWGEVHPRIHTCKCMGGWLIAECRQVPVPKLTSHTSGA